MRWSRTDGDDDRDDDEADDEARQPFRRALSTIPSTVNMRIPVPSASMNIAEPQAVVAWLKFTTPKP